MASESRLNTQPFPNSSRGSTYSRVTALAQQTTVFAGRTSRDLFASIGPGKKFRTNGEPATWLDPIITDILY